MHTQVELFSISVSALREAHGQDANEVRGKAERVISIEAACLVIKFTIFL